MAVRRIPRLVWRIIDVNANRAMEGARAAEEFVRFVLQERGLTARMRRLRHDIGHAVTRFPDEMSSRLAARDTRRDVGRDARPRRSQWTSLLSDNLQRLKESLRVLEECARAITPTTARHFQRLRFDAYALEQAIHQRLAALRDPGRRGAARTRRRGRGIRRH